MSPSLCPVLLQPPRRIPRGFPGGFPGRNLTAGNCHCLDPGLVLQPHRPGPFRRAHKGALSWELEPSECCAGFQGTPQALRKGLQKLLLPLKGF